MVDAFILSVALFFAFVTSPSTLCNGLTKNLNSEDDPIKLACRKVSDFGFCVVILRSDQRSARASVHELALIALDKLEANSKDTLNYLQGLQKTATTPEKVVVDTCVHFYSLATNSDVPTAVELLNQKAYGDAQKAARAAMNDGGGCQQIIDKNPSTMWQMQICMNKYMGDLCQLSSDLIGLSM